MLNKLAIFKKITDYSPLVLENIHHELRVAAYAYNPSPWEDYCELKIRWGYSVNEWMNQIATWYTII